MSFADHVKTMFNRFQYGMNPAPQAIAVQPASFGFQGHRGTEIHEHIEIAS